MIYKNNNLYIEKINTLSLSKRVGTPFYCYSDDKLKNI